MSPAPMPPRGMLSRLPARLSQACIDSLAGKLQEGIVSFKAQKISGKEEVRRRERGLHRRRGQAELGLSLGQELTCRRTCPPSGGPPGGGEAAAAAGGAAHGGAAAVPGGTGAGPRRPRDEAGRGEQRSAQQRPARQQSAPAAAAAAGPARAPAPADHCCLPPLLPPPCRSAWPSTSVR